MDVVARVSLGWLVAGPAFEAPADTRSIGDLGSHLHQSFWKVRGSVVVAWPNRLFQSRDRRRDEQVRTAS